MSSFTEMHHYNGAYFVMQMPNHAEVKQQLLKFFEDVPLSTNAPSQTHHRITKYDYLAIHTEGNRPWQEYMRPIIKKLLSSIPIETGHAMPLLDDTALWFQQYESGDIHTWHHHSGCNFGAVYYVEAPDREAITEFIDPFLKEIVRFEAKEGDVVIFPAMLVHRSGRRSMDARRKTVVAWNMNFETHTYAVDESDDSRNL